MTESTCAALTAVFPLVLLTVLIEGRRIDPALRKSNWYTWSVGFGTVLSTIGVLLTVIGVQVRGLSGGWDIFAWVAFGAALLSLFIVTLLLALSYDHEDDRGMALALRPPQP